MEERKPIKEKSKPIIIQRARGHKHQWQDEGSQENGLRAYTCKICGYGLLIDEKVDSIANY